MPEIKWETYMKTKWGVSPPARCRRIFVARYDNDPGPVVIGCVPPESYFDRKNGDEPMDLEYIFRQTQLVLSM